VRGNKIFAKKKNNSSRFGIDNRQAKLVKVPLKEEKLGYKNTNSVNLASFKEEELEQISIEHSLIAVFVNKEDAK